MLFSNGAVQASNSIQFKEVLQNIQEHKHSTSLYLIKVGHVEFALAHITKHVLQIKAEALQCLMASCCLSMWVIVNMQEWNVYAIWKLNQLCEFWMGLDIRHICSFLIPHLCLSRAAQKLDPVLCLNAVIHCSTENTFQKCRKMFSSKIQLPVIEYKVYHDHLLRCQCCIGIFDWVGLMSCL